MGLRRVFKNIVKSNSNRKAAYIRKDFLQSIPSDIKILEIGPFFTPMHKGPNVKYFDVEDQQNLIRRAKNIDPDFKVEDIPFIDYVSPTADLTIIEEEFDAVFSSHVIEHQFDLIDHLQKAATVLSRGGRYYLVVPDKRYCFDHFQQVSTIADVIGAHYEKRKKHTLKSLLDHRVLTTHNDPVAHWKGDHGELSDIAEKIQKAIAEYEAGGYVDTHGFFFTPTSFKEILDLLFELGYINFKVNRIHETAPDNFEFFCVLEKTDS